MRNFHPLILLFAILCPAGAANPPVLPTKEAYYLASRGKLDVRNCLELLQDLRDDEELKSSRLCHQRLCVIDVR
jgi:hypothetical protein